MITRLQVEAKRSAELMQSNMNDAQVTADKSASANEALQAIQESVAVIRDMNTQIATAAEEQTHVAGDINVNVVTINDIAKGTCASSNEAAQMAQSLAAIASSLHQSVAAFKL